MWRRTALLAAGIFAAGAALAPVIPAAQAAAGCQVDYAVQSQWADGFQGAVTVHNLGDAINGWTLTFDFPTAGQKVTQGWSATWTQSGTAVKAVNSSWNAALPTNGSVSLGFLGSSGASNPVPTSFKLNGVICNGDTSTPTPSTSATPTASSTPTPTTSTDPGAAPALHVSGNQVVTAAGTPYRFLGVNRSGGEFACIKNRTGIWDGPMDQASVTAMRSWKIRTVRVPLNEECWLGTTSNPVPEYSGTAYQNEVKRYVKLLIDNGITPIVELHWSYGAYTGNSSGCADVAAVCQKPMPDTQYSPAFWTGVANAFKGNDAVVFDLFNEPYPERATGDATSGWKCWRDGGTCAGINYSVAGFQTLVNAVRATGATNVIVLGGLAYSNDLSQWLAYKPADPLNNLVAMAHVYNFNTCASTSCWDSQLAPVAAQVPLVFGEIGENDCAHGFVDGLMNWADAHSVGYLGWTWNTWDCASGPSLISDYDGTATAFGQGIKTRLAAVSN
ncbi:cellulase family glycosylhydrolase [Kineosporia sp. J2-2]|uniref:Endoglucanase n=1 Tax=Kineosporia corallincola TaxID=2835133 RepID=A0ABS5TRS6_9ACTN|nr:cellulose binding domain-containing protein [Kineosporia corallincola]MBT0773504.1 cellulase family glycosylhydrolase [Kineosporia corallincola]